jgi:hypothetical protein
MTMHVTVDLPAVDYWTALGIAVAGVGLVFACLFRRRLGTTAMILLVSGCAALVLSAFLLFASQNTPARMNDFFFVRFFSFLWHALGVAGLALVIAASFAGRRATR